MSKRHDIHIIAREGSKARKMAGWAVMFAIPVPPSNKSQMNVTIWRGKNGDRMRV